MNKTILLIDDDERLSRLLADLFDLEGYNVAVCQTGQAALEEVVKQPYAVAIADVHLPDMNGIELVRHLRSIAPAMEVIVLTAHAEVKDGVEAMKNGAFDYAVKTGDHEQLMLTIARAAEKSQLQSAVKELQKQLVSQDAFSSIIGVAPALHAAIQMAKHAAQTDIPTLLLGETGTGKEVFARSIHNGSTRSKKPFIALNCSAIPADLLESELFGYQKGAFSGAVRDKRGLIEEAHEGTLFLDEIGEMPMALQSKMLRVLETRKFSKVGSTDSIDVDFRIIAATNRNPQEEINAGRFRADLYYRLEGFTIILPALRERREDMEILAQYFLTSFAAKYQKNVLGMMPSFLNALAARRWKGNVRELRNAIERAVVLCTSTMLTPDLLAQELDDISFTGHLPQGMYGMPPQYAGGGYPAPYPAPHQGYGQGGYYAQQGQGHGGGLPNGNAGGGGYGAPHAHFPSYSSNPYNAPPMSAEQAQELQFSLRRAEDERARQEIVAALQSVGGHREKAAKLLGISPATLYRKLQKFDIR
ncbi:MAG: sigma-54-dependent Fis family transcriptional regulator [Candidatus Kapaibacterium sp.]|nr:MAG: sigma-54-dependent Fis family transcriptional regulator [Candidatus Kapabacteria bacterium]